MPEYISRDDLLNAINTNVAEAHGERCSQLLEAILNAPTADVVEARHGEWMLDGRCSECLERPLATHINYCPNCGAKMDGERKEQG